MKQCAVCLAMFLCMQQIEYMMTFALLAICAGNSPVPGEFPAQKPVTQSFDVFFDLRLNKRLRKQSWGWWFETHRAHYDVIVMIHTVCWLRPKAPSTYSNENKLWIFSQFCQIPLYISTGCQTLRLNRHFNRITCRKSPPCRRSRDGWHGPGHCRDCHRHGNEARRVLPSAINMTSHIYVIWIMMSRSSRDYRSVWLATAALTQDK